MGQWLEKYGYTIYGTRGGPFKPTDWGVSTRKGNKIYLHILKWVGTSPKIDLPDIGVEIKKCTLAGRGEATFSKKQNGWAIQFDGKLLQPVNTIVEIELDGNAMDINPLDVVSQSLSFMKEVKASSESNPRWPACKSINNGDWVSNYWQPAKDDQTPWVEIDLGKPQKISKALIYESGNNIKAFELLYKEGEKWKTIHKGATIGSKAEITFKPIESQFVKLVIDSFTDTPGIYKVILLEE
jgi:alpha-L-fucosidase